MREWVAEYCLRRAKRLVTRANIAFIEKDARAGRFFMRRSEAWEKYARRINACGRNAVLD